MPEGIAVNGDVVTWARERAGLSPEEAAQKFPKIAAWEAAALPSYPQLESWRPVSSDCGVLFPSAQRAPDRGNFRTLPDAEFARFHAHSVVPKSKGVPAWLYELTQGATRRTPLRGSGTLAHVTNEWPHGARLSRHIARQQMAWRNIDEALKEWRQAIYRVGIFAFKDAFREESFSGFSLYDDVFPIIYANNSVAKTRPIFTLFHELGHLLFHTSGIDPLDDGYVERLPNRPRHIEVLCNRFAAQFLLPEKTFEAAFAGHRPTEQLTSA